MASHKRSISLCRSGKAGPVIGPQGYAKHRKIQIETRIYVFSCLTGAYLDFAENGQGKESEQYGDIFKKYKDQYNCCNDAYWVPSICIVNRKLGEYVVWMGVRMEDT
ncbi:hypothetical protein B0H11DRAFT_1930736 [Mycena galericulata]|nr:hypothetical protein B0H11DRAFT_1930736 [Mycena galericulata]